MRINGPLYYERPSHGAGKVLTSDSNGKADWADPPATSVEEWLSGASAPAAGVGKVGDWYMETGGTPTASPPLVSSLPSSPVDGQEVYYLADATNSVLWHLRYRAAAVGAYKWEHVGGSPMIHERTDQQGPNSSTTWFDIGFGPTLTVPLAGDYLLTFGVRAGGSVATAIIQFGIQRGAALLVDVDTLALQPPGANYMAAGQVARVQRANGLTAGMVLKAVGKTNAGSFTFNERWLSLQPVRVG